MFNIVELQLQIIHLKEIAQLDIREFCVLIA